MAFTMFLLFALYLVFVGFLTLYFGNGLLPLVMLGGFAVAQYFFSDTLALRSMGAREVTPEEQPELHRTIERLSQQADLPKPNVAVADSRVPNAFATGRNKNNATVAVTTGLLRTLDQDELEGVLAHELAHVKNRDVMVMTIASFLSTIAFFIVRVGMAPRRRQPSGRRAPVIVAIAVSLAVWWCRPPDPRALAVPRVLRRPRRGGHHRQAGRAGVRARQHRRPDGPRPREGPP
jgi:Zn-dependent protease with chaperone function